MSYVAGTKYCYVYSDKGVLLDHGTSAYLAEKFDVRINLIYNRIQSCSLIKGCFISYESTFDGFLDQVKNKYELDNKQAEILVRYAGKARTIAIGENSFKARTAYFENENEYCWQNTNWNDKYRPHLEEIEQEYQKMKEEILIATKNKQI